MEWVDTKKTWEIDHDWEYIGVTRVDSYDRYESSYNAKVYQCTQCESYLYGEKTIDERDYFRHISPFRPKDSGCQILYAIERLRKYNKELKEELMEYESAFKTMNNLLNRNKHDLPK